MTRQMDMFFGKTETRALTWIARTIGDKGRGEVLGVAEVNAVRRPDGDYDCAVIRGALFTCDGTTASQPGHKTVERRHNLYITAEERTWFKARNRWYETQMDKDWPGERPVVTD